MTDGVAMNQTIHLERRPGRIAGVLDADEARHRGTLLALVARLRLGDPNRMRHEEVNASEVYQSIRNAGIGRLEDVLAVVLEVDGT
jgi:hypothetical protein